MDSLSSPHPQQLSHLLQEASSLPTHLPTHLNGPLGQGPSNPIFIQPHFPQQTHQKGEASMNNCDLLLERNGFGTKRAKKMGERISKHFRKMTKNNRSILSYLQKLTQQIRLDLLDQFQPANQQPPEKPDQLHVASQSPTEEVEGERREERVVGDEEVVGRGLYCNLLRPTAHDNDAESDEQNLQMGVRYLYHELAFSTGQQLIARQENTRSTGQREEGRVDKSRFQKVSRHPKGQKGWIKKVDKQNMDFNSGFRRVAAKRGKVQPLPQRLSFHN